MVSSNRTATDVDVPTTNVPIVKGPETVLVDTRTVVDNEEFMTVPRSVIDPADLKWIWLTHTDLDHIGSLDQLLAENTELRVITTFLAVGIKGLSAQLPLDRVHHLVNSGENMTVADRTPTAVNGPWSTTPAPPASTTIGPGCCSAPTAFGLLSTVPESAAEISEEDLRDGQVLWATVDSP